MAATLQCPDCGATLDAERICQDHFHQMLYWEAESPGLGEVHHLLVLCYHLQHPRMYSQEGLQGAKNLLVAFLEAGISPGQARSQFSAQVNSRNRSWKIRGTEGSRGYYEEPVTWTMTAADVVAAGKTEYIASVRRWAATVLESLRVSGVI